MLDQETKRRIDTARDILVGKVPDPKSQVEQITIALTYKFMDDMDKESEEWGGKASFFTGEYAKYAWSRVFDPKMGGFDLIALYGDAIVRMNQNPNIPQLFRDIFKNAYLPYRDPETLKSFLKEINDFKYDHSERLGDAYEYLLSIMDKQGDAGQFRTPRHIIDFIVEIVDPRKNETVLDPACGTAGFLISSYKHILKTNTKDRPGDKLTPDERKRLLNNFVGYDISPDMVRLSLVNMYLHGFSAPRIIEYDTLTSEERWNDTSDVVLANPPFMSPKGGIRPHKRFSIQAKRSEVLFVDYIAEHLNPHGRAGVIVPEGIIFQSQTAYKNLRKMLVEGYLWAVASLPAGVFNPYSGVKTSILFMDKALAKKSDKILFVKVENDGFDPGAQRKPIEKNHIPRSIAFMRKYLDDLRQNRKLDETDFAWAVEKEKIAENGDWSLSGERYRETSRVPKPELDIIRLSEITDEMKSGFAYGESDKDPSGVPHLRPMNVTITGHLTMQGTKFIPQSVFQSKTEYSLSEGDILFNNTNSKELVGKTCYVGGNIKCGFSNHITRIRVRREKAIPQFIAKILHHMWRKGVFRDRSNKWIGQAGINNEILSNIEIPLPPLDIQKAIVAEIDGYQKIIDGARQVVENYKPTIKIDPEWEMVELGRLCEQIQYGLSNSLNTSGVGYKTFRMNELIEGRCIDGGEMKFSEIASKEFQKYRLERGDILFNRTNSIEHVGRTGIFDLSGEYCFASYLIRLSIKKEKADPFFVNAFMNTESFQQGIKQYASRAIGQANINAKSLANYPIPLPSLTEQREILTKIKAEQEAVNATGKLISIFEQKIKDKISEIWGDAS